MTSEKLLELENQAKTAFKSGEYNLAENLYNILLNEEKNSSKYLTNRALCKLKQNRWQSSFDDAMKTLEINSTSEKARYIVAKCCEQLGQIDRALNVLQKGLEINHASCDLGEFLRKLVQVEIEQLISEGLRNSKEDYKTLQLMEDDFGELAALSENFMDKYKLPEKQEKIFKVYIRLRNTPIQKVNQTDIIITCWASIFNDIGLLCNQLENYNLGYSCHLISNFIIATDKGELSERYLKSTVLANLALDCMLIGRKEMAERFIEEAIIMDEKLKSFDLLVDHLIRKAKLLTSNANYLEALTFLERAESFANKLILKRDIPRCIAEKGFIYQHLQLFEKSIGLFAQAIKLCEELQDIGQLATYTNFVGEYYYSRAEYEKALENLQRVTKICPFPYLKMLALQNIGKTLFALAQEAKDESVRHNSILKANESLSLALEIASRNNDVLKIHIEFHQSIISSWLNDPEVAHKFEIVIKETEQASQTQLQGDAYCAYADYMLKQGDTNKALDLYSKAEKLFDLIWKSLKQDEFVVSWTNRSASIACNLGMQKAYLYEQQWNKALDVVVRARSRALREEMINKDKLIDADFSLDSIMEITRKCSVAFIIFSQLNKTTFAVWMLLPRLGIKTLLFSLTESNSNQSSGSIYKIISCDIITEDMPKNEILRTFNTNISIGRLKNSELVQYNLDTATKEILKILSNDSVKHIYFLPDGLFNYECFANLFLEDTTFLISKYSFSVLPLLHFVHEICVEERADCDKDLILLVGNPDISKLIKKELNNLPFAVNECKIVSQLYGQDSCKLLIGYEAQKKSVMNRLEESTIFHIAAHADLSNEHSDLIPGALVLCPDSDRESAASSIYGGFLTCAEIQTLNLNRLQLAFLNCCNTGSGKQYSEGFLGLGRAFLYAGAREVVLSLWEVADCEETSDLVREFYTFYRRMPNAARALRHAQFSLAERGIHEKYWASFFVISQLSDKPKYFDEQFDR